MGLLVFVKQSIITKQFTFGKPERLKSRKLIEDLFSNGKSFSWFPVKVLFNYLEAPGQPILQAGVSVGTKRFKKAVDRNRIKRLLREAYRLQKPGLKEHLEKQGKKLVLFFIYTGKELPAYDEVYEKIGGILDKLIKMEQSSKAEQ